MKPTFDLQAFYNKFEDADLEFTTHYAEEEERTTTRGRIKPTPSDISLYKKGVGRISILIHKCQKMVCVYDEQTDTDYNIVNEDIYDDIYAIADEEMHEQIEMIYG